MSRPFSKIMLPVTGVDACCPAGGGLEVKADMGERKMRQARYREKGKHDAGKIRFIIKYPFHFSQADIFGVDALSA